MVSIRCEELLPCLLFALSLERALLPEVTHDLTFLIGQDGPLPFHLFQNLLHILTVLDGSVDSLTIVAKQAPFLYHLQPLLSMRNTLHLFPGGTEG